MTARNRPDARRCPNCGAPAEPRVRPFCSKRCRDLDLARWLDGRYAIPVIEEDGAEDDELSRSDRDR